MWCSPLAAALQPPKQAGHLGSLSFPRATTWSCLEKLQQKDVSRFLLMFIFVVSITHVPKKRTFLQCMVAPEHMVLYKWGICWLLLAKKQLTRWFYTSARGRQEK